MKGKMAGGGNDHCRENYLRNGADDRVGGQVRGEIFFFPS